MIIQMNDSLFQWVISLRTDELTAFFRVASFIGGMTISSILVAALAAYLFFKKRPKHAMRVFLYFGAALVLTYGLKLLTANPRPESLYWLVEAHSDSFPSGHAMRIMFFVASLWVFLKPPIWLKIPLLLISLSVCMARVYLGVHWPLDVTIGGTLGLIYPYLFNKILPYVQFGPLKRWT
jgi:membrane-associated phospholipid phosphatase